MHRRCRAIAGALLLAALAHSTQARAGDPKLDAVSLPPVTRAPWRFKGFPIIAWWGPPGTATEADFQAYKDAGFTLHATNPDTGFDQALEYVEKVGLSAMPFRTTQGFALPAQVPMPFPDRPSIVGWLVGDEPSGYTKVIDAITEVNRLLREDPTRWAYFNMLPPNDQTAPSTDDIIDTAARLGMPLVSYDNYPILAGGTDRTSEYTSLDKFRAASKRDGIPLWAFALTVKHLGYRRPSESDLRWQHFSNLAYGAKGLWYFTYWGPVGWSGWDSVAIVDPATGAKTELWEQVSAVNHTALAMGGLLLSLTHVDVVHTLPPAGQRLLEPGKFWIDAVTAQDALVGFFVDPAGAEYAMVVNKLHGAGKYAIDTADDLDVAFAPDVLRVEAVSWLDGTPGPLALTGGHATLHVAGGTGVLLRKNPPEPPEPLGPEAEDAGIDANDDAGTDGTGDGSASGCGCSSSSTARSDWLISALASRALVLRRGRRRARVPQRRRL